MLAFERTDQCVHLLFNAWTDIDWNCLGDNYAWGVWYNTRANLGIRKSQTRANRAAKKYLTSRDAMLSRSDLFVTLTGAMVYPFGVLKVEDIRRLLEALMRQRGGGVYCEFGI